jgi:ATP-binding cassette subfamily B multidrug efflux pump
VKALLRLNKYLLRHKRLLILGAFFIVCSNLFGILSAPLVRTAIDTSLDYVQLTGSGSSNTEIISIIQATALTFGILILISAILKGVFMYFMRQTLIVMSREIEYDLKNDIFKQYQSLDSTFYNKNYTGDLMNRITEDVSQVRMYLGPAIMYTFNLIVLFTIVISVMISINPVITAYVLIPLPILSISIYYVSDIMNKRSDRVQQVLSSLTSFVQDTFSGIRVIKSYASKEKFDLAFEKHTEDYKHHFMRLVQVNAAFFPLTMMLVGLSVLLTVYVGGNAVIDGTFTFGNIAEFVVYVTMLTWPVASLGWVTSIIQRASASQSRINEFLDSKASLEEGDKTVMHFESLEFRNVQFTYPGANHPSLTGLSFTLKKGDTLGILGTTGSGKSTIASLLFRLYDKYEGQILLNGIDLKAYKLEDTRALFSIVNQDIFLFSDTIGNNIVLGSDGNDVQRLEKACRQASVWDEIQGFSKGLETILGERGISLSGGQKQRVAIARALYKPAEVLILDDSLSAVDTRTESLIKSELRNLEQMQTHVIISHRISSIEDADVILVLDDGKLQETGSFNELAEQNGLFKTLLDQQTDRQ